jgi:hypothetical protein
MLFKLSWLYNFIVCTSACLLEDGKLVKYRNKLSVYLIENCTRREFPDANTFVEMGHDFSRVEVVGDEVLSSLRRGTEVTRGDEYTSVPEDIVSRLTVIRENITQSSPKCLTYGYTSVAQDYLSGRWREYLSEIQSMVFPNCLNIIYFGNSIGTYLNEMACAMLVGAHFIAVPGGTKEDVTHHHSSANHALHRARQEAFLHAFPSVLVNPRPRPPADVEKRVQAKCKCTRYCWDDPNAPWTYELPLIKEIVRNASDAYLYHDEELLLNGTVIDSARDFFMLPNSSSYNSVLDQFFPLIPDVTIQYRCSDNLGFNYGALGYGLLPFRAITKRIKSSDKYIYVLAEPAERSHPNPFCGNILVGLMEFVHDHFPETTVIVKRGGDPFLDYVRFINSPTTICSASTFCFYAALAAKGVAHYPLTNLIVQADPSVTDRNNAPDFGSNFKWIFETETIFHFKKANSELLSLLKQEE